MSSAAAADLFVRTLVGDDDDLKRRDLGRQPEAVLVVVLLDGGGQDALDADAIAAHDGRDFLAVAVEHARAHGFGIFVAELEDVADFDGGIDAQRSAAVRTAFAGGHAAQVDVGGGLEVSPGRDVLDVIVLFVRAGDQVFAAFESLIDQQDRLVAVVQVLGPVDAERSEESGGRMEQLL